MQNQEDVGEKVFSNMVGEILYVIPTSDIAEYGYKQSSDWQSSDCIYDPEDFEDF